MRTHPVKHERGKTSTKGRGRMRGDRSDTHTKRDLYYNRACECGKHSTEIKTYQCVCSAYLNNFLFPFVLPTQKPTVTPLQM